MFEIIEQRSASTQCKLILLPRVLLLHLLLGRAAYAKCLGRISLNTYINRTTFSFVMGPSCGTICHLLDVIDYVSITMSIEFIVL